jgi:hypothetical protein
LVYKASAEHVFCVYVFAKSDEDNIGSKQLQELKLLATTLLAMNDAEIKKALNTGALQKVT